MLDREATIVLNMVPGIGYIRFRALLDAFGSASAAVGRQASEYRSVRGIGADLAAKLGACRWQEECERECGLADRAGVRIVTWYDEAYPEVLRQLYDPPLCLYIRGRLDGNYPDGAVGIVGSRRMTRYGEKITHHLSASAAGAGFTVISGLAFGVDTVAHRAAVEAGGITVAVLGGGMMHLHPRENIDLACAMVEHGGALVTEFPMDYPVSRSSFPRRNRIVAALSRGVIVTEAGLGSGALITARAAIELGRDVFAVPGNVDNPQAQGCHALIKEGAGLIESFDDVLNAFGCGFLPGLAPGVQNDSPVEYCASGVSDLAPELQRLVALLDESESTLEELQQRSGMETSALLGALMQLELKLLVERGSDMIYRLKR